MAWHKSRSTRHFLRRGEEDARGETIHRLARSMAGNSDCGSARRLSQTLDRQANWPEGLSHRVAEPLSNIREESSIPAASGQWRFPSERQFYRATTSKGHIVSEKSMTTVVQIHNAVNEETWRRILEFERLHEKECKNPKLLRFVGNPNNTSLKARFNKAVGFESPFDSHHWFVDRCGSQKRYLIDFYDGKSSSEDPAAVSIYIDARPEFSFEGILDQLKLFFTCHRWLRRTNQS